ncbi:MAG: LysM peptidoglycan-binding domain-containing protein [Flavisolibacter sp.]
MKKNFLLALILFCCTLAFSQNQLIVQSSSKGLYIDHKVSPKENFYSIGRLYHISPKEIESFNGLDMNKGLVVGQNLKIPLTASNFSQGSAKGQPVYYVVGPKEGLYKVSQKNNNVLMADLRKWNKLSKDNISAGEKLIVGFLVASESNNSTAQAKEPVVKQEEVKQTVVEKKEPVATKQETAIVPVNETKKNPETERKPDPPVTRTASNQVSNVAMTDGSGGYFKPQFDLQVKTQPIKADQTASAGIFKTSSGWQDGKYYALIDNVEPGTIVKVVNPTNNKAIYAKVLGEMSGIRQNQGYDVRISNAAASALNVSETDKFIVRVNY